MKELKKRLILSGMLLCLIISFGTFGYMSIEGWSLLDSLYMTMITLTTVGFKEIHDLSVAGKVFTIILVISGVGTVFYSLGIGAQFIVEGELHRIFWRKRLEKRLEKFEDHYIICGFGRMGKIIAKELLNEGKRFIVIEKETGPSVEKEDILLIHGDATRDETLKTVGIGKAKCLISVLPSDAENLFVVLSARGLNPNLFIVARAGEEGSEKKLLRAGADRVVSPYHIGGLKMAHTVLKPAVADFLEFATKSGNIDLQLAEIPVVESSKLAGLTLSECGIGRDFGVIIVAIQQSGGDMKFNPTFSSAINAGDTLIAVGEISKLKKLQDMAKGIQ